MMLPMNRLHIAALASCIIFFSAAYALFTFPQSPISDEWQYTTTSPDLVQRPQPKVAKVSVIYGEVNEYYESAIRSHQRHADRHGYPFFTLRNPVAEGYWNKAEYLHSILVQELGKPVDERVEWLMWVDADSAIINPEIPVEIFLPPADFSDVHFLTSKDQNGLNTGIFFVRVHPWSVNMFTKTLGYPIFNPDVDLGYSADQTAMALIFNETENQPHVMYQPRKWYNTYQFHHGYEGSPGYLLVHFPGLEDDRWNQMGAWLSALDDPREAMKWSMPVEDTHYPREIEGFWVSVQRSHELVELAKQKLEQNIGDLALSAAIEDLKFAISFETDQLHLIEQAIEEVVEAIER